jgi:hypothetical protein
MVKLVIKKVKRLIIWDGLSSYLRSIRTARSGYHENNKGNRELETMDNTS